MIPLSEMLRGGKSRDTGAEGRRDGGVCVLLLKENMLLFWGDEAFLKLKKGDCCATFWMHALNIIKLYTIKCMYEII